MKRVIAKMFTSYDSQSDEYTNTLIQYLQEQKALSILGITLFNYWKTIDKEEVPTYAWIQRNTLGFTDWKSKWFGIENVLWTQIK
jgi:MarR-like DNA-binding transcriptional regulator SgrR of sgrS sRNA